MSKKGFIFSILIIAMTSIFLAYVYFQYNVNESEKQYNIDLLESKKIEFVCDNISENINSYSDIQITKDYNALNFIFNINNPSGIPDLNNYQYFYNNTFVNIVSGSLSLNVATLTDNIFEIYFDNSYLEYDYVNKIVRVIPTSDFNYNIIINSDNSTITKTIWTYSSGKYVSLNYNDANYSYNNSGYINGNNACNTNKFTINYFNDKLTLEICKYSNIANTLIIDLDSTSNYYYNLNLGIINKENISDVYYNADLNYALNNSVYSGKIKVN